MRCLSKRIIVLLTFIVALFLGACSGATEADDDEKVYIVTTIAQIGEPLSVIGGDHVHVESLMGPTVDPHLYQATQGDIEKLSRADIIFYNGLTLEVNMFEIFEEISPSKPVLAIAKTVPEELLLYDENGNVDPHIWFDIHLWMKALENAVELIKNFDPDHADYYEKNKQAYFAELEELKKEAEILQEIPKERRILVTAHDAFGYFGRMHDMEVVGLQGLSTEDEVGVSDIQETIELIKKYQVPAVFIESSISEDTINAVLEGAKAEGSDVTLGGELYSDAMGEPGTEEGTYIGMYRHNVLTIYRALNKGRE